MADGGPVPCAARGLLGVVVQAGREVGRGIGSTLRPRSASVVRQPRCRAAGGRHPAASDRVGGIGAEHLRQLERAPLGVVPPAPRGEGQVGEGEAAGPSRHGHGPDIGGVDHAGRLRAKSSIVSWGLPRSRHSASPAGGSGASFIAFDTATA